MTKRGRRQIEPYAPPRYAQAAPMAVDQSVLDTIALCRDEYELIVQKLGREPNEVELGLFGALWSEHCGYKNSKPLLRLLPAEGAYVLTRRGAENAGAIDIGDGMCVVMKIESHNHPSAVEPYQGAATGVGGIVRDIFAMGARPIALLDSLRFGPPSDPQSKYLFEGVVAGIGGYGNCLGIPTVGGEVFFEDAYAANPLVNAMCVGVARVDQLVTREGRGAGQHPDARRLRHRPRRHPRRVRPRLAHRSQRALRGDAPRRAGGQPVPREDAARSVPRPRLEPPRLDHRHPGPRRGRPHVVRDRVGEPRRHRHRASTWRRCRAAKRG